MALAKSIIAQIRRLERALNQALLRLQDTSDVEALHDVRITCSVSEACCDHYAVSPA